MSEREANFDGLVGPTHNYAGLAPGNVASRDNAQRASNPRAAALQGLEKMAWVMSEVGYQGIIPPQARPDLALLRSLGFTGDDAAVLGRAGREAPALLAAAFSASSMWTANAATVTSAADAGDGRVHFTVANLLTTFHRSIEVDGTERALRRIFPGERFVHHGALPAAPYLADEGAANHTRLLCGDRAVQLFVHGREGRVSVDSHEAAVAPRRFPARQTLEASEAVARRHRLDPAAVVHLRQNPDAIDAGVFHNDVISVGHGHLLLHHAHAFADTEGMRAELARAFEGSPMQPRLVCIGAQDLSLEEAVSCYLFNTQWLSRPDGRVVVLAPMECAESSAAQRVFETGLQEGWVDQVEHLDLRQSMRNGGGPACLRLRVPLGELEWAAVHPGCVLTPALLDSLRGWVGRHYRDRLVPADLLDPQLQVECERALDELTRVLDLGSDFYAFQRE